MTIAPAWCASILTIPLYDCVYILNLEGKDQECSHQSLKGVSEFKICDCSLGHLPSAPSHRRDLMGVKWLTCSQNRILIDQQSATMNCNISKTQTKNYLMAAKY